MEKNMLTFTCLSFFLQDIEFSPSRVQTLEDGTMTAWCWSVGGSVSPCSGRRQTSRVSSLCCHLRCTGWTCRLETMATLRQGTATLKDVVTLIYLEILSQATIHLLTHLLKEHRQYRQLWQVLGRFPHVSEASHVPLLYIVKGLDVEIHQMQIKILINMFTFYIVPTTVFYF